MPLRIPSDLYSGGQVSFNTTPFTNTVLKDIAEKKAARAALIKNADALKTKLNYAGVRPQDIINPDNPNEGIKIQAENWYRNAIGGKMDMNEYNDILYKVQLSKNRAEFENKVGEFALNKKIQADKNDVNFIGNKVGLSIYNPSSKKEDGSEYVIGDLPAFVPNWEPNEQGQFINTAAANAKADTQIGKPTVSGNSYVYKFGYSNDALKEAADNSLVLAVGNEKIEKHVNKLVEDCGDGTVCLKPQFSQLSQAYKSVYGNDAQVDTPEKALKAWTIDNLKRKIELKTTKIAAPRVYRGRGGGGSSSTGTPRDIWTPAYDILNNDLSKGKTQTDLLDATAAFDADLISDITKRVKEVSKYTYPEDITLKSDGNTIKVYDKSDGRYLFNYDRTSANVGKTPGVKGKDINIKIGNPSRGETKTTGKGKYD